MLGTYFYHEIIRKTIISFGTLFNNIFIRHEKSDGSIFDETKVGLSYGPMQKFLAKIEQQNQLTKSIAITLDLMDQVPISSNKDVEVEIIEISSAKQDEKNGYLNWEVKLEPAEAKTFIIKFAVKFPKDKRLNL